MTKRITALEKLETVGVSLVERGANRKQFVEKSGDAMDEETLEVLKTILADVPAENEAKSADILKDDTEDKARGAIVGIARLMSAFKDVLKAEDVVKAANLAGIEDVLKTRPVETTKAKTDSEDDFPKNRKGKAEMTEEEMKKAYGNLPEEVREKLASLWKSSQEADKKASEAIQKAERAEAEAAKLRGEALVKEYISKAEKDYAHLPGQKADDLGRLLKSLHDADPEAAKKIEDVLKAADKAVGESPLLKEFGTTGAGAAVAGSAEAEMDSLAKSYVSKSDKPLSYDEAYVRVMEQHPHLYKQYLNENPHQSR